ncbi:MAG: hypothetical protein KDB48_09705 [Solirubrobacterales bacterium]|nr:hypothetical protein [Solirubrobacterales bacterium]HMT06229.1 hypothetical protein [Solirubrobacterales bacterium]
MRSFTRNSIIGAVLAAITVGALAFSAGAQASTITIYRNALDSTDSRAQLRQMRVRTNCERGGSPNAFRFELGRKAEECFYRVPVVGRDLQVTATARIFKSTPPKVLRRAYAGVSLRQNTDGSRYQLVVWPSTRRFGLRKVTANGRIVNLGSKRAGRKVNGPGRANKLTLRAFDGRRGGTRLIAWVNGNKVVTAGDEQSANLIGRDTSFSIGAKGGGRGAIGSFVDLSVAMPDPF